MCNNLVTNLQPGTWRVNSDCKVATVTEINNILSMSIKSFYQKYVLQKFAKSNSVCGKHKVLELYNQKLLEFAVEMLPNFHSDNPEAL